MGQGTPGPWQSMEKDGVCAVETVADYGGENYSAIVADCDTCDMIPAEERAANAALIAAAPDLLAACNEALEFFEGPLHRSDVKQARQMLQVAIARAIPQPSTAK